MRLLHLSDIHFREPECLDPRQDPDRPFRSLLMRDVRAFCKKDGPIDAIFVSGDIAFKGNVKEYEAADEWLQSLAQACGCPPGNILVVPGNHDVDRNICSRVMSVSNAQAAIVQADNTERERVLRKQLQDQETGKALFAPLAAYNHFAAKFECNVFAPEQPFWQRDLPLGAGVILRTFGLTSTLISGLGERDAAPGRLYLSPLQTVLDYDDEVLNLVICHHPPSWFLDAAAVDDAVNNRAGIQLFGHEHRLRCIRDNDYIRFAAGAVNPDRGEPDWKPGYNLVELAVQGCGPQRVVEVKAHLRHYQTSPERFVAVVTRDGQEVWTHRLPLPGEELPSATGTIQVSGASPSTAFTDEAPEQVATSPVALTAGATDGAIMENSSTHNLVYRFWSLSISQKREIALKLGLIAKDDLKIAEPERYTRALRLAAEKGLLEQLAKEIEQREER